MQYRTLAVKVGAGLSAVLLTALFLATIGRCPDCEGYSLSASEGGGSTTTLAADTAEEDGPRSSLLVQPTEFAESLDQSLGFRELLALGEVNAPAPGPATSTTAAAADTAADIAAGSTDTTVAGDGSTSTETTAAE
ncbi:MAG: hypothetical protein WBM50_07310, partial [Acidimicrobiales bacterium]